ncbi:MULTISPECIES: replication-relaxation family protein [Alicyclobacillaceae]|nr:MULTISPECIES: replication-relaxation family protein [Alicyclobacillaceae]
MHLYGFFTRLISESLPISNEGLVEWIGMRDSGDRYAIVDAKERWTAPVRPDGIGTYRFGDGFIAVFHVEYDTGSEHSWTLYHKLWNYAIHLPKFWVDVPSANVLFITRSDDRAGRILELWEGLLGGGLKGQSVPAMWAVSELQMETDGVLQAVWNGPWEYRGSLRDFPHIDGDTYRDMMPLGKQTRLPPFVRG